MKDLKVMFDGNSVTFSNPCNNPIKGSRVPAGGVKAGSNVIFINQNNKTETLVLSAFSPPMTISPGGEIAMTAANTGEFRFSFWENGQSDPTGEIIVNG